MFTPVKVSKPAAIRIEDNIAPVCAIPKRAVLYFDQCIVWNCSLKLLVQPGAGVEPLIIAIDGAKKRVEIVIFRFDRAEVEKALVRAVERGVFVHALIAYTNRGGERSLRNLEMRLLAKGVNVARTSDDLVRYHSKFLVIDRQELHVLAFNFTYLDMEHSRSFAVITQDPKLVEEAVKLFEADTKRQPYEAGSPDFVVSPVNARAELSAFLEGAQKQLLIYDPKVGDPAILRILQDRAKAGVDVRIIGKLARGARLDCRELAPMRLHTRSVVRDGNRVFVGSQSLRAAELEVRREVGILFKDPKIAAQIVSIFEEDWQMSEGGDQAASEKPPARRVAKRFAKALTKSLPPIGPVLEMIVREVTGHGPSEEMNSERLEKAVKDAVKEAVEESVRQAVEDATERDG